MTFYFSADGSLKHTDRTVTVNASGVYTNATTSTSDSTSASSSTSSSSSFSDQMKAAARATAQKASGKMTAEEKEAAQANNPDYQVILKYQKKIQAIAAHTPRTFDDDEDISFNTTALDTYFSALESKMKMKTTTSTNKTSST
jgi:hypothetical protein